MLMTETNQEWKDVARDFASRKLQMGTHWLEGEEYWSNARMLAEQGFLGITLPEEYGGLNQTLFDALLMIEELCKVCPTSGRQVYHSSIGIASFINHLGTEAQKKLYLPQITAGKLFVGLGMSEPDAGSAATDMKTTAVDEGDHYRLNGSKIWVSEAHLADLFVVYARFGNTGRTSDIGAILVERGTPGFTVGVPEENMSGEFQSALYFDDALVPKENVLTERNAFKALMGVYNGVRLGFAAQTLGITQAAFDRTVQYIQERKQFGKEICEFQGIQWMVADMFMQLEAARTLLYRAGMAAANNKPDKHAASVAKVYVAEAAKKITDDCLQLHGGYGFSKQYPLEWYYRCVRAASIAGGTVQVHRTMLAAEVLGRKFDQRK
ncbi:MULTISPECIES: acyl-CoA dehydrogenase family protein [Bacillaceae]|jgi:alkylation response protein AidB-like acyl-CoA dehydrogenase|uniref:Alkylation response protein AidB-like acyl-CoA dehydrogenase n=1 Tax=Neobacillus bataviensis TaxID=220685 RepID=A0A561DP10_9BACI|nr:MULTISPECIES: acyl-CoA dehydrogenase family protein [Neobacillus]MCM3726540.1 acyl-CoA dehydrogenase family protein [Neobacillus cucumis]MDR4949375.1 acyl-CoA dehydrogenase family protein [Neobacillus cucumis]TWE05078.1 alkylation response protein AidB-like acyl-CoA dehydrogenase [Neobacillus bataviensis]